LLLRERMNLSSFLSGSSEENSPPPAAKIFRAAGLGFAWVVWVTRLRDGGARKAVVAWRKARLELGSGCGFMGCEVKRGCRFV
jgi:hypothetical protein